MAASTPPLFEHRFHFHALPREVRACLVVALREKPENGGPSLAAPASFTTMGQVVIGVFVLMAGFLLSQGDFGSCWEPLQGTAYLLLGWLPLSVLLVGMVLKVVVYFRNQKRLPYPEGAFLFPSDLVIVEGDLLTVVHLAGAEDFGVTHNYRNDVYQNSIVEFRFPGKQVRQMKLVGREIVQKGMAIHRDRRLDILLATEASMAGDPSRLGLLKAEDPFFEIRRHGGSWDSISAPLAPVAAEPGGIEVVPLPPTLDRLWRTALACALVLAPALWAGRNLLSDNAAYAGAVKSASLYGLGAYVENGWRHREEATRALQDLSYQLARGKKTVSDLRQFLRQHGAARPDLKARALADIHAIYTEARARLATVLASPLSTLAEEDKGLLSDPTPEDDRRLGRQVGEILTWAEAHEDAAIPVHFTRMSSISLESIDEILAVGGKRLLKPGEEFTIAPMAPFFGDKDSSRREAQIVKWLAVVMGQVLGTEVLSLRRGEGPAPTDRPVLCLSWELKPSGALYSGESHKNKAFTGIRFLFKGGFRTSGTEIPEDFSAQVDPPAEFTVSYGKYESPYLELLRTYSSALDGVVYDTMAERAFASYARNLCRRFHFDVTDASGLDRALHPTSR